MSNDLEGFIKATIDFLRNVQIKAQDVVLKGAEYVDDIVLALINRGTKAIWVVVDKATSQLNELLEAIRNGILTDIDYIMTVRNNVLDSTVGAIDDLVAQILADRAKLEGKLTPTPTPVTVFTCPYDGLTFKTEADLNQHIALQHALAKVFTCPYDGITFKTEADLNQHIALQHAKKDEDTSVSLLDAVRSIPKALVGMSDALALFSRLGSLGEVFSSPDDAIAGLKQASIEDINFDNYDLWKAQVGIGATIGAVTGSPFGLFPMVSDCYAAGMGQSIGNIARSMWHPTRIQITDLVLAYLRGHISADKCMHDGEQLGYTRDDIEVYINLSRQLLPASELLTLWLRKEINDKTLEADLGNLLFSLDDIARLKSLTKIIPGANDLIRMAVREAFTPEIAEKFGQYENYPDAITPWLEKQGLSKEWGERYWASHWELPGINMGFEMLQRGVIDQSELNMLLRALDVMPFWRDKLTEISYSPFTRVDIRRMHKMGLLSEDDVTRAYKDVGYNDDKARKLTQFTIELNKEEVKFEKQAERDLTAGEIVSAYANVLIGKDDATNLLSGLGYDQDEIDLKLSLAELPALKRIRDARIDLIEQRLYNNITDINGTIDELNKLDMPPFEMEYVLLGIQLKLEAIEIKKEVALAKQSSAKKATGSS